MPFFLFGAATEAVVSPPPYKNEASLVDDFYGDGRVDGHGEDLVQEARWKSHVSVPGCDSAINHLLALLNFKVNPCILTQNNTQAGSLLVNELASRIANNDVPSDFRNYRIIRLDLADLIINENSKNMSEILYSVFGLAPEIPNTAIFLDNVLDLLTTRKATILLDYCARRRIPVITVMTPEQYAALAKTDNPYFSVYRYLTKFSLEELMP